MSTAVMQMFKITAK